MHLHENSAGSAGIGIGAAQYVGTLYIGRAVGSAIGGVLYAHDLLYGAGCVSMGFVAPALMT
jgi:predicted MFS family arabinose efflux permease